MESLFLLAFSEEEFLTALTMASLEAFFNKLLIRSRPAVTGTTALNRLQLGCVACIVGSATRISSQRGDSHAHVSNRSNGTRGSPPLFRKPPLTLDWKLDAGALAASGQILRQRPQLRRPHENETRLAAVTNSFSLERKEIRHESNHLGKK